MGKMKNISLEHKGYNIAGWIEGIMKGGGEITREMKPFFLTPEQFSVDAIKRNLNDGGYSFERIFKAKILIYQVYGNNYQEYNRSIELDAKQCSNAMLGINKE